MFTQVREEIDQIVGNDYMVLNKNTTTRFLKLNSTALSVLFLFLGFQNSF